MVLAVETCLAAAKQSGSSESKSSQERLEQWFARRRAPAKISHRHAQARSCEKRHDSVRADAVPSLHLPSMYNCHRSLEVICRNGRIVRRPATPMLRSR